jgi:penicillin-binding protein 1A
VYFGKNLSELSIAEAATLAGLPKAPSRYNPVTNPGKAIERRHYVLQRMLALKYIDPQSAERAQREPMRAREFAPLFEVEAPYVAEMVRQDVIARFGEAAINAGYRVTTTIDGRLQTAANRAVRLGLLEYDRRHGYRGPLRRAQSGPGATAEALEKELAGVPLIGNLRPAVVVSVAPKSARVYVGAQGFAQIDWDGLSWARKPGDAATAAGIVSVGDVVYVVANGNAAQLVQLPQAQGALVSLDPDDGAIVALVGGYDYNTSKFNRVTQAQRQPGSGFKPFIYSAALEHGFTPASVIMDAPIMSEDRNAEQSWRPQNSSGDFSGPMRMREALVRSRNLVSIRLLRGMGPDEAINYATRFGFAAKDLPRNETLALGTLSATPLQIATGYATFANGGFKVDSYFIDRIENNEGEVVWRAAPKQVCEPCDLRDQAAAAIGPGVAPTATPGNALAAAPVAATPPTVTAPRTLRAAQCPRTDDDTDMAPELRAPRVISAANAWLMDDMLADVVRRGTGRGALVLGRKDIAGKTGTTNEERDTWFNGFNRALIASVWVGYDQSIPLGDGEEGSRTAVPIWVSYMREALRAVPDVARPRPANGLVTVRISPSTGLLASADDPSAIDETFLAEHLPTAAAAGDQTQNTGSNASSEPLF